jgi:hypothetical protein
MQKTTIRILLASCVISQVAVANAATPTASYDHSTGKNQEVSVAAEDGDTIKVTITNTCPDKFSYNVENIINPPAPPAAVPPSRPQVPIPPGGTCPAPPADALDTLRQYYSQQIVSGQLPLCQITSHDVFIAHDKKYAGYLIKIQNSSKNNSATGVKVVTKDDIAAGQAELEKYYSDHVRQDGGTKSCGAILQDAKDQLPKLGAWARAKPLPEADVIVQVTTPDSYVEFAGAFTVSRLTDPKFALYPNPAGGTGLAAQIIERNTPAEDHQRLGFAGFIHVHSPNCQWWRYCRSLAATFGLGINSSSSSTNVNFFLGPSYRLVGQWFITAGYNWGPVATLPAGERIGQSPTTANALSSLGSRTGGALFIAVSYSVLSPGTSFFNKPFATNTGSTPPK